MKLKKLEDKVRWCLVNYPLTRNNDRYLIGAVYTHFYNVDSREPFRSILLNDKLPSFESIGRARRKIQETDETLRGDKKSEEKRMNAQVDFIEYALSD